MCVICLNSRVLLFSIGLCTTMPKESLSISHPNFSRDVAEWHARNGPQAIKAKFVLDNYQVTSWEEATAAQQQAAESAFKTKSRQWGSSKCICKGDAVLLLRNSYIQEDAAKGNISLQGKSYDDLDAEEQARVTNVVKKALMNARGGVVIVSAWAPSPATLERGGAAAAAGSYEARRRRAWLRGPGPAEGQGREE